jgi:hypothetical protein
MRAIARRYARAAHPLKLIDGERRGKWRLCIKIGRAAMARNAGLSLGDRRRTLGVRVRRFFRQGAGAAGAIARTSARDLGHDPPDRSRAPPTLRAAAETAIDLACHARRIGVHNGPNLMVGQDVARTNDHPARLPWGIDGGTTIAVY